MISPEHITAIGTVVTALGIAIVGILTHAQRRTLMQVEKQGNSVALEQKRTTSVALRLLANNTNLPEHLSKASDAEKVYDEALRESKKT